MDRQVMGRLWTAVLLLAVVFAVHGAQCTAATHEPAAHIGTVSAGNVHLDTAAHDAATAKPVAPAALADPTTAGPATDGPGSGSWAAHLWTVCLAVLAAGLAVLLALALRRPALMAAAALAETGRRTRSWLPPPHPPDLHFLCVLRT